VAGTRSSRRCALMTGVAATGEGAAPWRRGRCGGERWRHRSCRGN
jgi:hypothetical protein